MGVFRFNKDGGLTSVAQEQREHDEADKRARDAAAERLQREQDEAARTAPAPRSAAGTRRGDRGRH
jgi:hypothetical protein